MSDLTGQDLAYWVAMSNAIGSPQTRNIVRRDFVSGIIGPFCRHAKIGHRDPQSMIEVVRQHTFVPQALFKTTGGTDGPYA